ncbi:hypothetical protein PV773_18685 [Mesorhizobium sp. CC13]|uniref:hypothetical protein n=1 Tax=Mesorhizobium sp. CC13 TaxID=3029194 RepID=UPI00326692D0
MLWSIVSVSVFGVLLGLSFRVPALLAATAATALATGFLLDGPLLPKVLFPVLALQCAYLVGLSLANLWRRIGAGSH